jgi:HSP20 family protein
MNIVRWNPALDVLSTVSDIDRVFGNVFGSDFRVRGANGATANFLPVDIYRKDDVLHIQASVPGFSPDEVNISVDGDVLTIQAKHEATETTEQPTYMRRERVVGELYRQISLGEGLDGDKAAANFDNGVLTITIPVVRKPEPRRIPVNTAQ